MISAMTVNLPFNVTNHILRVIKVCHLVLNGLNNSLIRLDIEAQLNSYVTFLTELRNWPLPRSVYYNGKSLCSLKETLLKLFPRTAWVKCRIKWSKLTCKKLYLSDRAIEYEQTFATCSHCLDVYNFTVYLLTFDAVEIYLWPSCHAFSIHH